MQARNVHAAWQYQIKNRNLNLIDTERNYENQSHFKLNLFSHINV